MENLIFCLNATIPIFLTLVLGFLFRRIGLFDDTFVSRMNKFVFAAALPALLFQDISSADFYDVWDGRMVLFCFLATLASIAISTGLSFFLKPKDIQGEFIQASYRSSAALLGIAVIQNLYGNAGMAPLMIIASVPLYNVMAVTVLSFFRPGQDKFNKRMLKNTIRGIVTNPIILGILAGMIWSVLKLPKPVILDTTINNLGKIATPLGLMAMGGSLKLGKAFSRIKAAAACTFLKLIGFEALFLPLAVSLGFTKDKLVAIIIMLGSATTVSCFIMAKNMDHEGSFSSGVILLTTLLSAFTLTFWLFLCRNMGLI
ncbi:MAG: AEC family transporter [Eubacteriales bacterium]|nr:AEC family transporter [Eubacteriales bacterium]